MVSSRGRQRLPSSDSSNNGLQHDFADFSQFPKDDVVATRLPSHPQSQQTISHNSATPNISNTKQHPKSKTKYNTDNDVGYDSIAAEDYKWAKSNALSRMNQSNIISHSTTFETSSSGVRPPTNVSLTRSSGSMGMGMNQSLIQSNLNSTPVRSNNKNRNSLSSPRSTKFDDTTLSIPVVMNRISSSLRARSVSPMAFKSNHDTITTKNDDDDRKITKTTPQIISKSNKNIDSNTKQKSRSTQKEIHQKRLYYASKNYAFQQPHNYVSSRMVDLSTRTAFEPRKDISIEDLKAIARERYQGDDTPNRLKKMSPSPQYVEILNAMHDISYTRQLCWNTCVSAEADPFNGWSWDVDGDSDDEKDDNNNNDDDKVLTSQKRLARKRRKNLAARDNIYRQVDRFEYARSTLPKYAPPLTNIKRRLPMRSDVGFPRVTEEEIAMKQSEIVAEAGLEEISPRLILMLTSDDIGTVNQTYELDPKLQSDLEYSLPGIPFAGKHLYIAKKRNQYMANRANKRSLKQIPPPQPNPMSTFAPPIESSFSSTEMWRSRPFVDRPPGLMNMLAIPLDVHFDTCHDEPLICTLSLYALPKNKDLFCGKISEDFIFPAGNWKDLLEEKAGNILAQQFGLSSEVASSGAKETKSGPQKYCQRRKALFSFDPLHFPSNSRGDKFDKESLFLVLQVQKVTQKDALDTFFEKGLSKKNSLSSMKKIFTGSSTIDQSSTNVNHILTMTGFQFLTTVCYGLVPIIPHGISSSDNKYEWPNGINQQMHLISYPVKLDGDEDFLSHLLAVADAIITPNQDRVDVGGGNHHSDPQDSSDQQISLTDSLEERGIISSSKKTKGRGKKIKKTNDSFLHGGSKIIDGSVKIFTSFIGSDFTQALLQSPHIEETEMDIRYSAKGKPSPRLLVDSSGDFAIMVDPNVDASLTSMKRSNLIRLPPSSKPNAYSDSSEVREVLYLPPSKNRRYDSDFYWTPKTSLNVLYLYPRLLRITQEQIGAEVPRIQQKYSSYSIRVRLIQQNQTDVDNPTYTPIDSFYNSGPGGDGLLQSIFTKIPLSGTQKENNIDIKKGMKLNDEIKLRLPRILDGSHFIEFTLYFIQLTDDHQDGLYNGLTKTVIAETYIPLSSSTTKEPISGARVMTVIPNGLHRIKLGQLQLQVETRIMSSIHISDPAIATIIRDFPSNRSSLSDERTFNFSTILSKASDQGIVNHFQPLLFFLTRIFMTSNSKKDQKDNSKALLASLENMNCIFVVLQKVRSKFNYNVRKGRNNVLKMLKEFIDHYDDRNYLPSDRLDIDGKSSERQNIKNDFSDERLLSENSLYYDNFAKESEIVDLIENNSISNTRPTNLKKTTRSNADERLLYRQYSSLNKTAPFTRKAYGASKTDRMKAEAELYATGQMMSQLHDDDETIVTASTWQSHGRLISSVNSVSFSISDQVNKYSNRSKNDNEMYIRNALSNNFNRSNQGNLQNPVNERNSFSNPLERAKSIAKKVLAPCVAPSPTFQDVQLVSHRNNKFKILSSTFNENASMKKNTRPESKTHNLTNTDMNKNCGYPGSDYEEEISGDSAAGTKRNLSPYPNAKKGSRLRGIHPSQITVLQFTLTNSIENVFTSNDSSYIYEIIFAIWYNASGWPSSDASKSLLIDHSNFTKYIDFVLPLCLKSIVLRCIEHEKIFRIIPTIIMDHTHMQVLSTICVKIADDLLTIAMTKDNSIYNHDLSLVNVLALSESVVDFFIGLIANVHPSQISWLIYKYLQALRELEDDESTNMMDVSPTSDKNEEWLQALSFRIRCSQHLRLRVAESLACLPSFLQLNFPYKYTSWQPEPSHKSLSWTNQVNNPYDQTIGTPSHESIFMDRKMRLPETNWLGELLLNDCFLICSQSCESFVSESIQRSRTQSSTKQKKKLPSIRRRVPLPKSILVTLEATALHAITVVYELILRTQATDHRFQKDDINNRVAGIFVSSVIDNTIQSLPWLSKLSVNHKVRNLWLLGLLYIFQEGPESLIRSKLRSLCEIGEHSEGAKINHFIQALVLCVSTFQSFILDPHQFSHIRDDISAWLCQESFNTISAAAILVIDECFSIMARNPNLQQKMVKQVLDLILSVVSSPQSSVTLLRALGAASHTLDQVGSSTFIKLVEDDLQHWGRVIFTLMNSTQLSVRSMAVDLTVSLFGSLFKERGNVDNLSLVFLTVLPEVVAREIGMYSISHLIRSLEDVCVCLWPLRRAIADIEEADPIDDDRVDEQLLPSLSNFCRVCQAIIDGVLIELRLKGDDCFMMALRLQIDDHGSSKKSLSPLSWTFDADEESLYEAASFFVPETSPVQRLRWLLTLKSLHESKGQYFEAAETLILCAKTLAESIPHLKNIWIPTNFKLWIDSKIAPWLSTIGSGDDRTANTRLQQFSESFLMTKDLKQMIGNYFILRNGNFQEQQPIAVFCRSLVAVAKAAVANFEQETNSDQIAFIRLESLLKIVMHIVEQRTFQSSWDISRKVAWKQNIHLFAEENASLRKMSAAINELVTKLAEKLALLAWEDEGYVKRSSSKLGSGNNRGFYVCVQLLGRKPTRFQESTTVPTFLDWETPCICRVSADDLTRVFYSKNHGKIDGKKIEDEICMAFAEPYLQFLRNELGESKVELCHEVPDRSIVEQEKSDITFFVVTLVHEIGSEDDGPLQPKSFHLKKHVSTSTGQGTSVLTELTVAHRFPCALSRQPVLLFSQIMDPIQLFKTNI